MNLCSGSFREAARGSGSGHGDHDFAETRGIFHGGEGPAGLSEGTDAIGDRMKAGLSDGAVHFQKMLARASVDATYLQHFVKDRRDGEALLAAAEHADLGDDATRSGRCHGLL